MNRHADLRLACLAAVVCAGLALVVPVPVLSLLLLVPLAFYLPGYVLIEAFFARRELEQPQAALFSVGASLAVLALGALPLNYLPGGITAAWWSLALVLVVLVGARLAASRRPPSDSPSSQSTQVSVSYLSLIAGLVALLLAGAAVAAAFIPIGADKAIGYTQLWILPSNHAGQPTVRIGVSSDEQRTLAYELRVAGSGVRPTSRSLTLRPGETREIALPLRGDPAVARRVGAALFRANLPETPYRRVYLQLPPQVAQ